MKFDIQLFADTVVSSTVASIVVDFYDGDTRTITIDNANESRVNAQNVNALAEFLQSAQPIIGDKTGASVTGVSKCTFADKSEIKFDLS